LPTRRLPGARPAPAACAQEDREQFSNAVRSEVKAAGLMDTPENLWDFFIEKARASACAAHT